MKYFIIDNFIDDKFCESLISASSLQSDSKDKTEMHGGRDFLSSTTLQFNDLINNSKDWSILVEKLNSPEFLNFCLKKLDLKREFSLVDFFKSKNLNNSQKSYKKIGSTKSRLIPTKALLRYFLKRVFKDITRKIKYSKLFYSKKSAVELLFDYSKAGNGYSRSIHRDSDNRLVVFILYLNSPSQTDNHTGGNFDIYKLINKDKNLTHPDAKNCSKIESIEPKSGKLIVFLNENESFHGVEKMNNHEEFRHFIYGGFTLLNEKNPYIVNQSKVTTEFHLYD